MKNTYVTLIWIKVCCRKCYLPEHSLPYFSSLPRNKSIIEFFVRKRKEKVNVKGNFWRQEKSVNYVTAVAIKRWAVSPSIVLRKLYSCTHIFLTVKFIVNFHERAKHLGNGANVNFLLSYGFNVNWYSILIWQGAPTFCLVLFRRDSLRCA